MLKRREELLLLTTIKLLRWRKASSKMVNMRRQQSLSGRAPPRMPNLDLRIVDQGIRSARKESRGKEEAIKPLRSLICGSGCRIK